MRDVKAEESMETDDKKCYIGQMAAQSILKDIDKINMTKSGRAKNYVLPLQSDLRSRKEIASLDKEQHRQKKSEGTPVDMYATKMKEQKWKLQSNQLKYPISDTYKYFLQCLLTLLPTDRKYFLQCLKLGLDDRSVKLLQPKYEEYEKLRTEEESEERDKKLVQLDQDLTHGSLGIEHFFREITLIYENMNTLKERIDNISVKRNTENIFDFLTQAIADLLLDGTAIEIMDGDAVDVPVAWLTEVFQKIERSSDLTVFKVSALGAQSCGKSTLLNTSFGLNFPVSSDRCTRGAYMQLVKVNRALKKRLQCDYVAVIDSEGLMSRTKMGNSDFDNELSTFIIGLSDLTLVVIKGEGSEMYEVLPLAIHAFLRMNLVEHQACHFVHQNMGAVDVMSKVATEIDAFVKDLNAKTLVAAKDTDQSEQYTKFTDVLQYDPIKDNTYVPGLWDGSLPMAKINVLYSKTMYHLKFAVVESIRNMKDRKQKTFLTFEDFAQRLKDLWDGIKYENFVFSFRNVLAVEAHRTLTGVFNKEQWALKREFRAMKEKEDCNVEKEIRSEYGSKALKPLVESSKLKLLEYLDASIETMRVRIQHYFQCPGCTDCNSAVKNRHLLANNEKEFEDEVNWLRRTLERELDSAMEELEVRMDIEILIQDMDQKMNDRLKNKVRQILSLNKSKEITKEEAEKGFKDLWDEMTQDAVRSSTKMLERGENIRGVVQDTVKRWLGPEDSIYRQKKMKKNKEQAQFNVKKKHIKTKMPVSSSQQRQLESETENIISRTSKYYNPTQCPKGKKFNKKDVELLFKEVLEQVDDMQEQQHIKITDKYKMGLLLHIEKQAVKGFTELHKKYCDESSPAARLKGKMQIYYDIFMNKIGQGDDAVSFCNSMIRRIILCKIDEFLGPTRLLDELRKLDNDIFKDVKALQASITAELVQKDQFDEYHSYLINHEMFVKAKLKQESVKCFNENNRLKNLAKSNLEEIVEKIVTALHCKRGRWW